MSNLLTTSLASLSEKNEKHKSNFNVDSSQSSSWQIQSSLEGPVAILWDIGNCPVPRDVRPEDVASNIRMCLRTHPTINGPVTMFSAYGDFNTFSKRLREGCQRTGVKLVDVPNGRKDAADMAILVDMFLFALDNRPPSSILLISGDIDFAPALHILGQRGYTIILVIPSGVGVSSALTNAGRLLWDWSSVARGEGFVPQAKTTIPRANVAGFPMGCPINECIDSPNEEEKEKIVHKGVLKSNCGKRDFSMISETMSECIDNSVKNSASIPYYPMISRSQGTVDKVSKGTLASSKQNHSTQVQPTKVQPTKVQPRDLNVLKGQLVKLLELSGGSLPLIQLPLVYHKVYKSSLRVSAYGASKLVKLLKKMDDLMTVDGKDNDRVLHLCNSKSRPDIPSPSLPKKDTREKGASEDNLDVTVGSGSLEEFPDSSKVFVEECGDDKRGETQTINQSLDQFKYELQDILMNYSGKIFFSCFHMVYQERYKKTLDYPSYGVVDLDELLAKVKDIVVLQEEPASNMKFLVALGDESNANKPSLG